MRVCHIPALSHRGEDALLVLDGLEGTFIRTAADGELLEARRLSAAERAGSRQTFAWFVRRKQGYWLEVN